MERKNRKSMPGRTRTRALGAWAGLLLTMATASYAAGPTTRAAAPLSEIPAANQPIALAEAVTPPLVPLDAPLPVQAADQTQGALSPGQPIIAQGLDPDGKLRLAINHSRTITTSLRLRSADQSGAAVSAGSADVVVVMPVSPTSILITAKKPGSTDLVIEDELGRRQVVEVIIGTDLDPLRQMLHNLHPQATIDVSDDNGSLVLRGRVPSLKVADQAAQISTAYYGAAAKVINLLEVSGGQQVMLQVKFAEVSKSVQTQLGINFGYSDGKTFFGNNTGAVNPFSINGSTLETTALTAASPGGAVQLFGNGSFGRSAFAYFINCLRQNQLMRTLAEPNLTAISGEQASFQVGGKIPIPVPQGGGTGGSPVITVEYEDYGVILHFTPVVLGDGHIRLKIDPEVSDLDYSHGVNIGGFVVPGFTTRTVDTTVELADGQTFTIAGLLNNQVTASNTSFPGLGDLPILGALFRSVEYQRNQTELVVMVTPRLVEALNPEEVPAAPGERWRYPSEADLFIARDLGGEASEKAKPLVPPARADGPTPQFHGQYGFTPTSQTLVVEP